MAKVLCPASPRRRYRAGRERLVPALSNLRGPISPRRSGPFAVTGRLRARSRPARFPRPPVDGLEDPDLPHAEAEGGEEQGEDALAHAVVEVVDEPRLGAGEGVAVPVGDPPEDLLEARGVRLRRVLLHLEPHVLAGIPHQKDGDEETRETA